MGVQEMKNWASQESHCELEWTFQISVRNLSDQVKFQALKRCRDIEGDYVCPWHLAPSRHQEPACRMDTGSMATVFCWSTAVVLIFSCGDRPRCSSDKHCGNSSPQNPYKLKDVWIKFNIYRVSINHLQTSWCMDPSKRFMALRSHFYFQQMLIEFIFSLLQIHLFKKGNSLMPLQ